MDDLDIMKTIMKEAENTKLLVRFVRESNAIEGITRDPTQHEISMLDSFLNLKHISFYDLKRFISIYEPGAKLRDRNGMNVTVGDHYPPEGGPSIPYKLLEILDDVDQSRESAFGIHNRYESLHPFTDGNGRSGRAIWLWQMTGFYGHVPKLSFLNSYYYQSLNFCRK